jgi:hypothetical protein
MSSGKEFCIMELLLPFLLSYVLPSFLSFYTNYEDKNGIWNYYIIINSIFCVLYFSIHKRLTHHVGLRVKFENLTTNKCTKTLLGNQSWMANNHVDPDVWNWLSDSTMTHLIAWDSIQQTTKGTRPCFQMFSDSDWQNGSQNHARTTGIITHALPLFYFTNYSSIPDGVIGIFHWHNPSGRSKALGLTQLLTEMRTRNISWWVKAAGA